MRILFYFSSKGYTQSSTISVNIDDKDTAEQSIKHKYKPAKINVAKHKKKIV